MRALIPATLLAAAASPAFAATGPFFSLHNTNFVVLLAFLLFICVLIYFKVFRTVGGLLDKRAEGIQAELDEARALREEAQSLLASYERRQGEVKEMAERIVNQAREDAKLVAEQAHIDLEKSIARRLAAAEDQIASAEAAAVKDVRDKAIAVALSASRDLIARQMSASDADKLIDDAIADVGQKLH